MIDVCMQPHVISGLMTTYIPLHHVCRGVVHVSASLVEAAPAALVFMVLQHTSSMLETCQEPQTSSMLETCQEPVGMLTEEGEPAGMLTEEGEPAGMLTEEGEAAGM